MDVYGLKVTTDAARGFLDWMKNPSETGLNELLMHPGYQAVLRHSHTLSFAPVKQEDFWQAKDGLPSNLYGLRNVKENACDIERLAAYVERNRTKLLRLVAASLLRLFDPVHFQNTGLNCIAGYDVGIGLMNQVAINLNSPKYLEDASEIDWFLIHEAVHVAYERIHGPMHLEWVVQPGGLRRLVHTLIQNEGLAVYAALPARQRAGAMQERDYAALTNPAGLRKKINALEKILRILDERQDDGALLEEVLPPLSDQRLSYVVGCFIFQQIEANGGIEEVRQAIRLPASEFISRYRSLLKIRVLA